ncbi:hypothetical protein C8Q80DRAFT_1321975 [Daedaleopsis nitida]|nr:hypothetical protein C8Q80DRAFT_1321975 [Daedaleopsis nitida]
MAVREKDRSEVEGESGSETWSSVGGLAPATDRRSCLSICFRTSKASVTLPAVLGQIPTFLSAQHTPPLYTALPMSTTVSTVLKGVTFENRTLRVLRNHLSMSLRRVGGKGDGGIDLQGWWWVPTGSLKRPGAPAEGETEARSVVRVLAQCKAEEKKIGPRFIREFEGTVLRNSVYLAAREGRASPYPASQDAVVGLFASISPFTKASLLQAYSSPVPLALLHLPVQQEKTNTAPLAISDRGLHEDLLGTLLFNAALGGANGLLRGTIEPRWERCNEGHGQPGLWTNGRRLESWVPDDAESLRLS